MQCLQTVSTEEYIPRFSALIYYIAASLPSLSKPQSLCIKIEDTSENHSINGDKNAVHMQASAQYHQRHTRVYGTLSFNILEGGLHELRLT